MHNNFLREPCIDRAGGCALIRRRGRKAELCALMRPAVHAPARGKVPFGFRRGDAGELVDANSNAIRPGIESNL